MVTDIGPSTVEPIADAASVRYPFQRKGFYARGYHFEFYYTNTAIFWRRSADGLVWSAATDITPSGETPGEGAELAVWLARDEEPAHHVHVAYADHDADSILYYRRATIDTAGNLTWDAVWQTAAALVIGVSFRNLTICVDDANGYPFIGYTHTIRADPASDSKPRVTHSQQLDGTWVTFGGFPKQLNATNNEAWVCVVVPYNGVYIMAVYARDSDQIRYDIYNITTGLWAGEVGAGVTIGADATKMSVTSQRQGRYVTTPRRVHVAYCDGSENLNHIRIEDLGVTGPTLIYASAIAMGPAISTRVFGEDDNPPRTLYVFWTPITAEPNANYVCYKKSIDDGGNWTTEAGGVGVEVWMDETGDGLSGVNIASSYFEEQHHRVGAGDTSSNPTSYLGLLYTNQGASPDYVRFAGLEFADPSAELLGTFCLPIGEELFAKFVVGVGSEELLGRAIILQVEELLGRFQITISHQLFAKFVVGVGSEELVARFDLTSSVELLGRAVITRAVELLARFQLTSSEELLGRANITHSEELLGRAVITRAVELLAKFQISGSEELLCRVVITRSDELLGKLRLSTDDWIAQGISVEAYIALGVIA